MQKRTKSVYRKKPAEAECYFCGREASLKEAVSEGWVPYFYQGKKEIDYPACAKCTKEELQLDKSGEWEHKWFDPFKLQR